MSSFEQLRQGLNRTWDQVTEGWRQLRERTADAITHFNPIHRQESSTETHDSVIERSGARWGVLAADVLDDNDNVIVKLEIPGLDAENFDIQVVEKYLVVRGEKRAPRGRARQAGADARGQRRRPRERRDPRCRRTRWPLVRG